jgi:putative DNA primase/helicase
MPFPTTIPDDLRERDQWVLWCYESRNGSPTKVPYQPGRRRASSTDCLTWSSFEAVQTEWERAPGCYAGPGFVFTKDDPYCGVDLDDALDSDETLKPWAQSIVRRFSDSYMEISPSGTGLKIWVKASLPSNLPGVKVVDGQIELYDHSRYFAVTGHVFRGSPLEIEDHAADIRALYDRLVQTKVRRWPLQPLDGGRIPLGQQHNTLVSIAGTLRKRRVCDEAIEACLQIVNIRQCERPGSRMHIANIVRSSRKWGATG